MVDARDEAKEARERVPSEPKVPRVALAQCPNCGNLYDGCGLRFLYYDEYGSYCPSCGGCLVEGAGPSEEETTHRCCLIISEGLEGSELHRHLQKLALSSGVPVLVDRTGEIRTTRLSL